MLCRLKTRRKWEEMELKSLKEQLGQSLGAAVENITAPVKCPLQREFPLLQRIQSGQNGQEPVHSCCKAETWG